MKVMAINGSPREKWNTAALLNKALEGAASEGAETELIQLYDLKFRGCKSCFVCKLKGGESYGKCAAKDELTPVLAKAGEADAFVFGSPIYFGTASAGMKAFMERLLFPYISYDVEQKSLVKKKIPTGFIYTMGSKENQMKQLGYEHHIMSMEMFLRHVFGHAETLVVNDTYQFDDYEKYAANLYSPEEKALRWLEVFPLDCQKAFDLGVNLVRQAEGAETPERENN